MPYTAVYGQKSQFDMLLRVGLHQGSRQRWEISRISSIGMRCLSSFKHKVLVSKEENEGAQEGVPSLIGLAWDLETTGLSRTSEIIQLAVTVVGERSPQETPPSFTRFVLPKGVIYCPSQQTEILLSPPLDFSPYRAVAHA